MDQTEITNDDTSVLYNAECPVCRAEIDHYAAYSRDHDLPIRFDDLNSSALEAWGISADEAAKRLHVRKGDQVYSGIPAFILLWQDMPRYRWLARVVSWPLVRPVAVALYDYVLAPILYRWHLARVRRAKKLS
ncbi:thiol-disulfide oxidoreductase DCC family protein [Pseudosulfitobacter koreensis]|uniref:DUF393 domain-containing protein n=1 Tax=Pseudosulfitobacter koreensis TaxID=2968472 RepID=A0ABT1Z2T2_9RHOB|nr:DUF393 domain-containing protein [Pseudosulfitobacter koreense]MCR8827445.1 DUF393 domain-containing protein [Pseudosulfitobacter koreense]